MNLKAFTLIEIMIVVAIIALLAAIAIPNLLRSRITAQEASAAAALHTIAAVEIQYRATNTNFATLVQVGAANPPYIDASLASGNKQGYTFTVPLVVANGFFACAVHNTSQAHSFYIDESGQMCRSTAFGQACPGMHMGGVCADPWTPVDSLINVTREKLI